MTATAPEKRRSDVRLPAAGLGLPRKHRRTDAPKCGALNRQGKPCTKIAMPNGRCANHGGKSNGPPLGTQNAFTHGAFSSWATPDEAALLPALEQISLDKAYAVAWLILLRCLRAAKAAGLDVPEIDQSASLELAEQKIGTAKAGAGEPVQTTITTKRAADWWERIDRCLSRIGQLAKQRSDIRVAAMALGAADAAKDMAAQIGAGAGEGRKIRFSFEMSVEPTMKTINANGAGENGDEDGRDD